MAVALAVVPEPEPTPETILTKEEVLTNFRRKWEIAEKQDADLHIYKASVLEQYMPYVKMKTKFADNKKITQTELAKITGISTSHIMRLLRCGRLNKFLYPYGYKIPEYQARQYWEKYADPAVMVIFGSNSDDEQPRLDYEQKVFMKIYEAIRDGKPPSVEDRPDKRQKKVTDEAAKSTRKLVRIKRKEVQEIYQEIKEDVDSLIDLAGASQNRYAPGMLAMNAKHLKEGFIKLEKALKGDFID